MIWNIVNSYLDFELCCFQWRGRGHGRLGGRHVGHSSLSTAISDKGQMVVQSQSSIVEQA